MSGTIADGPNRDRHDLSSAAGCWILQTKRPPNGGLFLMSISFRRCDGSTAIRVRFLLLGSDSRRLDDRPPFFDLGSLLRSESFRRLFFSRPRLLPQFDEALAQRGIGQALQNRGIELGNDALWRPFRRP